MIILIDNYDSFTFNVFHYLSEVGASIKVFRNDKISSEEIFEMKPQGIVLSPGPKTPNNAGICLDLIKKNKKFTNARYLFRTSIYRSSLWRQGS